MRTTLPLHLLSLLVAAHAAGRLTYFVQRLRRQRPTDRQAWVLYALTAAGMLAIGLALPAAGLSRPQVLAGLLLAAALATAIVVSAFDFRLTLIPDELCLNLMLCGVAYALPQRGPLDLLLGAVVGLMMLAIPFVVYPLLRGTQGVGLGDVKLGLAIGIWAGAEGAPLVIGTGSLMTLGYGLLLYRDAGGRLSARHRLPFAPGLLMSLMCYLLVIKP